MQDLLNIKNELIGGVEVQAVSARELYLGLGLMTNKWSRWAAKNKEDHKEQVRFIINQFRLGLGFQVDLFIADKVGE